ncbi:hypothetical protein LIA77_10502 [Sarocladium implicatum]|nr:hypothetical protein LIA77_10502 [Sarocladium implicatum]
MQLTTGLFRTGSVPFWLCPSGSVIGQTRVGTHRSGARPTPHRHEPNFNLPSRRPPRVVPDSHSPSPMPSRRSHPCTPQMLTWASCGPASARSRPRAPLGLGRAARRRVGVRSGTLRRMRPPGVPRMAFSHSSASAIGAFNGPLPCCASLVVADFWRRRSILLDCIKEPDYPPNGDVAIDGSKLDVSIWRHYVDSGNQGWQSPSMVQPPESTQWLTPMSSGGTAFPVPYYRYMIAFKLDLCPPSSMHDGSQSSEFQATASPGPMNSIYSSVKSKLEFDKSNSEYPVYRNREAATRSGLNTCIRPRATTLGAPGPRAGNPQQRLVFFQSLHSLEDRQGPERMYAIGRI